MSQFKVWLDRVKLETSISNFEQANFELHFKKNHKYSFYQP